MKNPLKRTSASNLERVILSPNTRIKFLLILRGGILYYQVLRDDKEMVGLSRLGFKIKGEQELGLHLELMNESEREFDETWETIVGEERLIRNHYNEKTFVFSEQKKERRAFSVVVRVFDDGVAFCYDLSVRGDKRRVVIEDELTEFNIDVNSSSWSIPAFQPDRYEYNYEKRQIFELDHPVHTPFLIRNTNGHYLAIHEAALYDYGAMTLELASDILKSNITPLSDGSKAHIDLPFRTPWRVIMMASSALALTTNRMMLNLNEAPKGDFSWVKALKFLGIWWAMYLGEWTWAPGERHGATTEHAKEYIDYCVKLGVAGLLIEGWNNGWEGDWLTNGPTNNFTKAMPDLDFGEVARYAKNCGVELVGHHETVGFIDNYEEQLEEAYKFYADHGVHYIKPGYAGSMMTIKGRREYHHSQLGVRHYQKTVELAAKYHIMLDIHEPIKSTGIERTWPNLLTREGARGQEYEGGALSPSHACFLPYTRLLAGGMDYTSGLFDLNNGVKRIASTLARQLAYFVTIFSGMQMAAERPRFYAEVFPDVFEFIRRVPVNFEMTVPLLGDVGEYYVVARKNRDDDDWFVGGVTNESAKRIKLKLDFLDGEKYMAHIYRDGEQAHYRDNQFDIVLETKKVSAMEILDLYMAPGGGFAIWLEKIN